MAAQLATANLLTLPPEVILTICKHLTTSALIQFTSTCRHLFDLASTSRDVLLQHLSDVPGIKLGLSDSVLTTAQLWLLLRQRATAHLFGVNFTADCQELQLHSGVLNPSASCLVNSDSHVNLSLVLRDSLNVKHYDHACASGEITTSPYADGLGRVIQVVHHGHFISVLYAWQSRQVRPSLFSSPSNTLADLKLPDRPTRVPTKTDEPQKRDPSPPPDPDDTPKTRYHLIHYDTHNWDRPVFFTIKPPKPSKHSKNKNSNPIFIPTYISVFNRLKVAVTWSESTIALHKRNTTVVMLYICDKIPPRFDEGTYTAFKMYPSPPPPPPPPSIQDEDYLRASRQQYEKDLKYYSTLRPTATAFRQQGSLLAIYAAGGTVPYTIATVDTSSSATLINPIISRNSNVLCIRGDHFKIEAPFFGSHSFDPAEEESFGPDGECTQTYLHLGVLMDRNPNHHPEVPAALCIVQTRMPIASDECWHYVDLDHVPRTPRPAWITRVVARLWGWKGQEMTSMSGLDTIAVSPRGTRIAISCWDKIYVWALQPEVFCEEWEDEVSEAGSEVDGVGGNGNGQADDASVSETASYVNSLLNHSVKGMVRATRYYKITKDRRLGDIVELKPIVLKLPGGAVARKMMWKTQEDRGEEEEESETESEFSDIESVARSRSRDRLMESENTEEKPERTLTDQKPGDSEDAAAQVRAPEPVQEAVSEPVEEGAIKSTHFSPTKDWSRNKLLQPVTEEVDSSSIDDDLEASTAAEKEPVWVTDTALNATISNKTEEINLPAAQFPTESDDAADCEPLSLTTYVKSLRLDSDSPCLDGLCLPSLSPSSSVSDDHTNLTPAQAALLRTKQRQLKGKKPIRPNHNDVLEAIDDPEPAVADEEDEESSLDRSVSRVKRERPRRKRETEDELLVLTDRGMQVWNLGVWGRGRREKGRMKDLEVEGEEGQGE